MSRESRIASRAGSRTGSRAGSSIGYGMYGYESNLASGYATPNFYSSALNSSRPDSVVSNQEVRGQYARNSQNYKDALCKGQTTCLHLTTLYTLEIRYCILPNSL